MGQLKSMDSILPDTNREENECAICLENLPKNTYDVISCDTAVLPCNHLFHTQCIRKICKHAQSWKEKCPTCRRSFAITAVYSHAYHPLYDPAIQNRLSEIHSVYTQLGLPQTERNSSYRKLFQEIKHIQEIKKFSLRTEKVE